MTDQMTMHLNFDFIALSNTNPGQFETVTPSLFWMVAGLSMDSQTNAVTVYVPADVGVHDA